MLIFLWHLFYGIWKYARFQTISSDKHRFQFQWSMLSAGCIYSIFSQEKERSGGSYSTGCSSKNLWYNGGKDGKDLFKKGQGITAFMAKKDLAAVMEVDLILLEQKWDYSESKLLYISYFIILFTVSEVIMQISFFQITLSEIFGFSWVFHTLDYIMIHNPNKRFKTEKQDIVKGLTDGMSTFQIFKKSNRAHRTFKKAVENILHKRVRSKGKGHRTYNRTKYTTGKANSGQPSVTDLYNSIW